MRKAFVEIKTAKKRAGEDVMSRMERIERRRGVKGEGGPRFLSRIDVTDYSVSRPKYVTKDGDII